MVGPLCTEAPSNTVIRRGFVPPLLVAISVWLWPAYKEFGAELLWGCITQTCNCVCVASSLWANATIKDAGGETCSFCSQQEREYNQTIEHTCLQSYLSLGVDTKHMMGAFTMKSVLFFPLLTSSSLLCLKEAAWCFGSHKIQYHCDIKEWLFFFCFFF